MARPRLDESPVQAAFLTPEFWKSLCGQERPSARDQFLYLTIHEFGRLGPGSFSPVAITRDLGYTTAMINHYFGSRRGLVSEAAFRVYEQYLASMRDAVASAERTPIARIRAWMSAQVAFAFALPGWAVVHNYPNLSLEDPVEFDEEFREEMTQGFELNMGRLAQLILDVESGNVSAEEVTAENFDRAGYLANQRLVELTASVAMSTLGAAVWGAGSHAPSRDTEEAQRLRGYVINQHIEHVIASL